MTTVINNPSGGGESSATGIIVGVLVALIIVVFFFVYAMPAIRGSKAAPANGVDVNVTLPTGSNTSNGNTSGSSGGGY